MGLVHDNEAEAGVIGSLLVDGDTITQVVYTLEPADFLNETYALIYSACLSLYEKKQRISQITVADELRDQTYGGAAYLSHLISECPTSLDIEYYAGIVKRWAADRALINLGSKLSSMGQAGGGSVSRVLGLVKEYQSQYTDMADFISPREAGDIVINLIDKYNDPASSMKWGFTDLDELTAGIFPGELNILGARPGTGKTQVMIDIAANLCHKKILFVSAEMTVEHVLERRVARELGVSIKSLRKTGVIGSQMDKIIALAGKVEGWGIRFLKPGVSSLDIYKKAVKMQETIGLDLVVVDYLQKLKDCYTEKENENVRIGRACQRLKDIATELNVPVVCASQFNRNLEYRGDENQKPKLSDLRGSGSIEQDADVILLLWRDDPKAPLLNIRLAKTRQVEPGDDIQLVWVKEQRRYGNLIKQSQGLQEA